MARTVALFLLALCCALGGVNSARPAVLERLNTWDKAFPGAGNVALVEGAVGRGLAVTKDIKANEEIFRIPIRNMLNVDNFNLHHPDFAAAFEALYDNESFIASIVVPDTYVEYRSWSALSAHLLKREIRSFRQQAFMQLYLALLLRNPDKAPVWTRWLQLMPKIDQLTNADSFDQDEIEELRGTNAYSRVKNVRMADQANYKLLQDAIAWQTNLRKEFGDRPLEWAEYVRAAALVNSRVYDFELGKEAIAALLPILDLINHVHADNASVHYFQAPTEAERCYLLKARRDIEAGEEIRVAYGWRPNREFLAIYGFLLPDNPENTVMIWPEIPEEANVTAFEQLRKQTRVQESGNEGVEEEPWPHELQAQRRLLSMKMRFRHENYHDNLKIRQPAEPDTLLPCARVLVSKNPAVFRNEALRKKVQKAEAPFHTPQLEAQALELVCRAIESRLEGFKDVVPGKPRNSSLVPPYSQRIQLVLQYRDEEHGMLLQALMSYRAQLENAREEMAEEGPRTEL